MKVSTDLDHSLEWMTKHACRLLLDADVLAKRQSNREQGNRGEYLLRLMGLEILLKASALQEAGKLEKFRHDFPKLFAAQPISVRDEVEHEFGARRLEMKGFDTAASLAEQLVRLKRNYTRARYVYEPVIENTREEQLAREQRFVEGALPVEDWDIIYHQGLVELLTEVLLKHLSQWIPHWFAVDAEGTT